VPQTFQGDISKDIVTGIAITCFLFGISIYLPIIGFFFTLFIPLPILFYRSKLGRKTGLFVPIATIVVIAIVLGGISIDSLFFLELLTLGFVLGELFEQKLSIEKTIAYASGMVLCSGFVVLVFYGNMTNNGIAGIVSVYISKNLELTVALYESLGAPEQTLYRLSNSLDKIHYVLLRIIPSLAAASTVFVAWVSVIVARPMFNARGLFFPDFGMLNLWKAPETLVWGVIGCGLMLFIPANALKLLALNGMILLMTVYFFQGIAIVSYFFEKKRFPLFIRIFFYSLIVLQQIFLLFVIAIGFFDIWLNFRRHHVEET
jgi:uncharacterized protein YybS (DUF2232 family)